MPADRTGQWTANSGKDCSRSEAGDTAKGRPWNSYNSTRVPKQVAKDRLTDLTCDVARLELQTQNKRREKNCVQTLRNRSKATNQFEYIPIDRSG